jgi:mRNA-degrading endonuclease YafQ of YafQ-DinJ toxin-antitoxin module
VDRQLDRAPREVLQRYEKWKDIAMLSGPPGLRLIKGFHDEVLAGEWRGHRSSRLGMQFRLIYRVVASEQLFQVVSVTAHDYRRP